MHARPDEEEVRALYRELIDAWNRRDAVGFAALIALDGRVVGFDGSMLDGRQEVEATLAAIFAHHQSPPYVSIVREVQFLTDDVAVLRAVVGMAPPGKAEIEPSLNAVQSLVAVTREGRWEIAHFQNTPAAFHGRPEEVQRMTEELRRASGN